MYSENGINTVHYSLFTINCFGAAEGSSRAAATDVTTAAEKEEYALVGYDATRTDLIPYSS